MADNSTQDGTDTIRTQDRVGVKTQTAILDVGSDSTERLVEDEAVPDVLMPCGGKTEVITATLTRPANTTAYTGNDEMTDTGGAIRTLTGIARLSGGSGVIRRVFMTCSQNPAAKPSLRLWIYDTTSTPQTDNAAFAPSDAEQQTALGWIDLLMSATGDNTGTGGNFAMQSDPCDLPFRCVGSANLFFRVQVLAAYTAQANSDTYTFRFHVFND